MKKILSIILCVTLMFTLVGCGESTGESKGIIDFVGMGKGQIRFNKKADITDSDITILLSVMNDMNDICESAPQQSQNGADTAYELSVLIAKGLDNGDYSSQIMEIERTKDSFSESSNSAIQEQVNSTYRTVEALMVVAYSIDKSERFTSEIDDVGDKMDKLNDDCESAPQQLANGLYRTLDILGIIAQICDSKEDYTDDIEDIIDLAYSNDKNCESAPQQAVNGAYRCVEMLEVIAKVLDYKEDFSSEISSTVNSLYEHNETCESAPQQNANGIYRMAEMLGLVAEILNS